MKKLTSLLLAAAMGLALAQPAGAAQGSGLQINADRDALARPGTIYRLRDVDWRQEGEGLRAQITGGRRAYSSEMRTVVELPLGTSITLPYRLCHVMAWADPDGDGVYDRLYNQYQYVGGQGYRVLEPATSDAGPWVLEPAMDEGWANYWAVEGDNNLVPGVMGEADYTQTYGSSLSAVYLTERFGANTLLRLEAANTWDPDTLEGDYVHFDFLLTGERADPALLTGALTLTGGGCTVSPWAAEALGEAERLGLVPSTLAGLDLTRPVTRAQFAAVSVALYQLLAGEGADRADTASPFADCKDEQVARAYALGIVNGSGPNTFSPRAPVSRQDAAVMLSRVFSLAGGRFTPASAWVSSFADIGEIAPYAAQAVAVMSGLGVMNGVGEKRFAPLEEISAQAALTAALRVYWAMNGVG